MAGAAGTSIRSTHFLYNCVDQSLTRAVIRLSLSLSLHQAYIDSVDLEFKDSNEADRVSHHSHVPWLVLVFRYYQLYIAQHGRECPRNEFAK